jgi:hypothetical protein
VMLFLSLSASFLSLSALFLLLSMPFLLAESRQQRQK